MKGAARVFGPEPLAALARVHAVSTAADACITVSLAGSLFFSVSVDAARPRLALYLLITLAPFAVVAPLIGPVTDRFRGTPAGFIAFTGQARAILALFIAIDLRTVLLYPEAFAVLVLGRSYSIVRAALVPELVPDPNDLVAANARLSRIGSVSGLLGGALAVGIFQLSGPTAVLRVAAITHVLGSVLAYRVPRPAPVPASTNPVEATPLTNPVEPTAPTPPDPPREKSVADPRLRTAQWVMNALRGASGLLTFLIAFALKRSGQPAILFGAVALAATLASFAGTFVSPVLRRHVVDEHVILGTCAAIAAIGAVIATAQQGFAGMVIATVAIALASSSGRHAFDSLLQQHVADRQRSRAFARADTMLEIAWVVGALVPTVLNLDVVPGYLTVVALGIVSIVVLLRGRARVPT
jgi:hypothetical protein